MKKALISPNDNNLIVDVSDNGFPVAKPLYWVNCLDDIVPGWSFINNEFVPPVVPVPVTPTQVSMRQARLALLQVGLLDEVNTSIATGTEADKITWEYATEVNRADALVVNMAVALNLTETDLDNLFGLAASL